MRPQANDGRDTRPGQQVRQAAELLEAVAIMPLSRPRVLAAARALGLSIPLRNWYTGAWELEQAGLYRRRGDGEREWLEPANSPTPSVASSEASAAAAPEMAESLPDPLAGRSWLAGALRIELERIHDGAALLALAEALGATNLVETERCLRAARTFDPHDITAALALARLSATRGDLESATTEVERVLQIAPDSADAHVLLANVLDDREQRAAARTHYERALALAPHSAVAHYNYGVLLLRNGQRDEAIRQLREACDIAPDDAGMRVTLAIVLMDAGDLEEAEALLRRARALDPNNMRAHRQYGVLLTRMGRHAQAEEELRSALALRPSDGITLMHLCAVLDELDRHAEAEVLFREAITDDPSQAETYFKWMLRHDAAHVPSLVNLALLSMGERRWTDAEPLLRRAIELAPNDVQAVRLYGATLAELEQFAVAEGALHRAIELAPDDETARAHLTTLLMRQGRRDEALALRREGLERAPQS
ncbi:MAG: tetratricopeptide repeat protein, partial [Ktedonobacterales bacterium]